MAKKPTITALFLLQRAHEVLQRSFGVLQSVPEILHQANEILHLHKKLIRDCFEIHQRCLGILPMHFVFLRRVLGILLRMMSVF